MLSKLLGFSFLVIAFNVSAQSPVVKTRQGYIRGVSEHGTAVFKGIPYAAAPVGSLRYKPPIVHGAWSDTLNAVQFGSSAFQVSGSGVIGSEDCLFLNLYTPGIDDHKRAVVIWVHGGSMTAGSGKGMDGHAFADWDDIVAVTINYRLGALGFLYMGGQSGNLGLLDVVAALRWVHDNIAAFGGDPNRVTIMGESAGAKLLSAVMVSPVSKGLYAQAILESGSVQCVRDSVTAKNARLLLLKQLGLGPDDVGKLQTMPADMIIRAQGKICDGIGGNSFFGPVYDGVTIPEDGYRYAAELRGIRVLIGTNENEGAAFIGQHDNYASVFGPLFRSNAPMAAAYYQKQLKSDSPYDAMVKTLTQYMYQMHSYRFAKALSDAGVPVWMYRFKYQGARHGDELHYIWGNDKGQLTKSLHGSWVSFIKEDDPDCDVGPKWPKYSDKDRQVMVFDSVDTVVKLKEVYNDRNFPSAVFVIK